MLRSPSACCSRWPLPFRERPSRRARRRAAAAALLLYAVLAVPSSLRRMTLLWLLVLLVVVVLTFVAASLSARRDVALTAGQRMVSAAVGIALAALLLISAAQTISLLTRVDPRTLVVVLAVVTGLVAALRAWLRPVASAPRRSGCCCSRSL